MRIQALEQKDKEEEKKIDKGEKEGEKEKVIRLSGKNKLSKV